VTRKEDLICGREPAAGVGVGRAAADLGYAVERRGENSEDDARDRLDGDGRAAAALQAVDA